MADISSHFFLACIILMYVFNASKEKKKSNIFVSKQLIEMLGLFKF